MPWSGKFLSASIGSTNIVGVMDWSAAEDVDLIDGTTSADGGNDNDDFGCGRMTVDMTLVQDIVNGVYSAVSAGTLITNLKLFRDDTDINPAVTIPFFNVKSSTQAGAVKDKFTVKVNGKSKGAFSTHDPI